MMTASRPRVLALTFCCLALASAPGQKKKGRKAPGLKPGTVRIELTEPGFEGLYYMVAVPEGLAKGKRYPLLFALHGNGDPSEIHLQGMSGVSSKAFPVFIVAPQYQLDQKTSGRSHPRTTEAFQRVLDRVCRDYPIDRGRMFLEGFSMGGITASRWTFEFGQDREFPFRAVFLNSGCRAPRSPAPRTSYIMWVGDQEGTGFKMLQSTRRNYLRMSAEGYDVEYIEMPDTGHNVPESSILQERSYIQACPDYSSLLRRRSKPTQDFGGWSHLAERGEFAALLRAAGEVAKGSSRAGFARRSQALSVIKEVHSALRKLPKELARLDPAAHGLLRYREILRLEAQLVAEPTLAKGFASARKKLERNKKFRAELEARRAFLEARDLLDSAPLESEKKMQALAQGKLGGTGFGKRAQLHLKALQKD